MHTGPLISARLAQQAHSLHLAAIVITKSLGLITIEAKLLQLLPPPILRFLI